jgi:hypothetical protein
MKQWAGLLIAAALMAGCAAPRKNQQMADWYSKEDSLRQAYKTCMTQNNKDASKCQQQRSDLYNQMEWNLLEQSD